MAHTRLAIVVDDKSAIVARFRNPQVVEPRFATRVSSEKHDGGAISSLRLEKGTDSIQNLPAQGTWDYKRLLDLDQPDLASVGLRGLSLETGIAKTKVMAKIIIA